MEKRKTVLTMANLLKGVTDGLKMYIASYLMLSGVLMVELFHGSSVGDIFVKESELFLSVNTLVLSLLIMMLTIDFFCIRLSGRKLKAGQYFLQVVTVCAIYSLIRWYGYQVSNPYGSLPLRYVLCIVFAVCLLHLIIDRLEKKLSAVPYANQSGERADKEERADLQ